MKVDCSKTENYLREKARMTKNCTDCFECPFSRDNNGEEICCEEFQCKLPKAAVEIVQKRSDEHPQKTYKDDFFEKFPDEVPACRLYKQLNDKGCNGYCVDCWNKTMEE